MIVSFIVLVFVFAFTFIFCLISLMEKSLFFAIVAILGYLLSLIVGITQGMSSGEEGGGITIAFYGYVIVVGIVFVWYLTKGGVLLGIW